MQAKARRNAYLMENLRIIEATLPLSPQNQIEYFKDKSILFKIDILNSKITPKQCFMTLSNMKLKAEIKDVTPEIITEYMTGNFVVETTNMAKICANLILGYKYQSMPYLDVEPFFSLEQCADYICENHEMISKWCSLVKSIPLLFVASSRFMEKEDIELLKLNLNIIPDRIPELGMNISQVLTLPDFLVHFFRVDEMENITDQPYYSYYFDEFVFGGDCLISLIANSKEANMFANVSLNMMDILKRRQEDQEKEKVE